jgi:hypothetical protein
VYFRTTDCFLNCACHITLPAWLGGFIAGPGLSADSPLSGTIEFPSLTNILPTSVID